MANYDLTNLAVKMLAPNNKVIVDDTGIPSVYVWIPKFKLSDVLNTTSTATHPAFIRNGKEISGFWAGKYQAKVYNNVAYSLPGEDPTVYTNLDQAIDRCTAKGAGHHLMTNAEWAAIALWCKKNGFQPNGNNNYGKDVSESNYKAVPTYMDGTKVGRVATGTGPVSWYHDGTMAGIADLNGNVWEWQGGLRTVFGEIQILANNDASDPDNPQNATSLSWKAIRASDGALVTPECTVSGSAVTSGATVKMDFVSNKITYSTNQTAVADTSKDCDFAVVTADSTISDEAKLLLRALCLLPDEGSTSADYNGDHVWMNNGASECSFYRGGNWNNGSRNGVFALNGNNSRSNSNNNIGLRAAYVDEDQ